MGGCAGGGRWWWLGWGVGGATPGWVVPAAVGVAFALLGSVAFVMKDGFSGQSPGKLLCGVQVVDAKTVEPIGFGASFVRNLPLLIMSAPTHVALSLSLVPALSNSAVVAIGSAIGGLFNLIGLLVIGSRLVKGPRWGDGGAGTKVVWKKFVYPVPFDLTGRA